MNRRIRAVALAAALAIVVTPTLSGCFRNPLEQIVEGATGGGVSLGSLPEGFPAEEVPVIDGEIILALKVGEGAQTTYNVTIKTGSDDPFGTAKDALLRAGFTEQAGAQASGADGSTGVYTSEKWGVLLVTAKDGDSWTVNYTVTAAQS